MKLLQVVVAILWSFLTATVLATSNGLTNLVTWDKYSLSVNGTRTFIFAGEFHPQRLPVPELWLDILQKFKANGFNAVSVYFFWSYHSASRGKLDLETSGKNIQRFLDYAKDAGLYVIARAGPYCNAETSAGGLALWGSDGSIGTPRTSDETYHQAWLPYITAIGKILAANEIGNGGPVILNQIENEFSETKYDARASEVLHMQQIEKAFRDAGVTVPFTHNEKGMRAISWSTDYKNVGGAVDVYGLDSYPGSLSCTNPGTGFNVVRTYYDWFSNYSFTQPSFLPEFEGGWFSPWGAPVFYDQCLSEHDPAFADVYYKNNIGQRVTMQGIYMTYGGTNWGHSAAPVVYSSYDYSAPLRETRQQGNKLFQTKLIGLFTRVSSDLLKTTMVGNGAGYSVSSKSAWSWVLKNPDTKATFTVLQQADTRSQTKISFSATLSTSAGAVTVPNVELNGRQSKVLVTDYAFGNHTLLYASADIAAFGVFDRDVLVFYLQQGQAGEFAFTGPSNLTFQTQGASTVTSAVKSGRQVFTWAQAAGTTVVSFSNGVLVYLLEQQTAWKFWAPATTASPTVRPEQQIFVIGPYLVRNASVDSGTLYIKGDNDNATTLEAYVGKEIQTIDWNGRKLAATRTSYGSYTAKIPGTEDRKLAPPTLGNWKSADSLPELAPSYDDSRWTVCNKTGSRVPAVPITIPVLYSSEYGYYSGPKVYRGYFDGARATGVNMTASGGQGFGWNAWLNGRLLGGDQGKGDQAESTAVLTFPTSSLRTDGSNVVTVVVDYHGHDQMSAQKGLNNPRGLLGARLLPSGQRENTGFKQWKIQGNAGGASNIDPVRGPMNEGGFYGERMGWHLPGFNDAGWDTRSPTDGIQTSGICFFRTMFALDLDSDLDAPLGIELAAPTGTAARVMIWVNGYQYGKYVPQLGPQTRFPVPPGVLNNRGNNTLALSLWAQTDRGARLADVRLFYYGAYQTGFAFDQDWKYLQPGWSDRSQYA